MSQFIDIYSFFATSGPFNDNWLLTFEQSTSSPDSRVDKIFTVVVSFKGSSDRGNCSSRVFLELYTSDVLTWSAHTFAFPCNKNNTFPILSRLYTNSFSMDQTIVPERIFVLQIVSLQAHV